MKPNRQKVSQWILIIVLLASLLLNIYQDNSIEQLTQELEDMENIQSILSDYINQLGIDEIDINQ